VVIHPITWYGKEYLCYLSDMPTGTSFLEDEPEKYISNIEKIKIMQT